MDIIERVLAYFGIGVPPSTQLLKNPPAPPPRENPNTKPTTFKQPPPIPIMRPHIQGGSTMAGESPRFVMTRSGPSSEVGALANVGVAGTIRVIPGIGIGLGIISIPGKLAQMFSGVPVPDAASAVGTMVGGTISAAPEWGDAIGNMLGFGSAPPDLPIPMSAAIHSDLHTPIGRARASKNAILGADLTTDDQYYDSNLNPINPEEIDPGYTPGNPFPSDPDDDPSAGQGTHYNGIPVNLESQSSEQLAARVAVPTRNAPTATPMIHNHPTSQPSTLRVIAPPRIAKPHEVVTEAIDVELQSATRRLLTNGPMIQVVEEDY